MKKYSPSTAALLARHAAACEMNQRHEPIIVAERLAAWAKNCGGPSIEVVECKNWEWAAWAASAARAARSARSARAASAAWAAWAAWDARDASAARDAWDARDASAASAAWDASAASAASAARDAWDASYCSVLAPGAEDLNDSAELAKWMPMLEAFENGAWLLWVEDGKISYVPTPTMYLDAARLHREGGPAFVSLNLSLWYIRGVEVDEQIVLHPETQSLSQLNGEQNAEVKRIRIERYGWQKYLRQSNARVIEHSRDDVSQTEESLMECDGMHILVGACPSTGRVYPLEVPVECRSIEQAQNFLNGGRARRIIGAT